MRPPPQLAQADAAALTALPTPPAACPLPPTCWQLQRQARAFSPETRLALSLKLLQLHRGSSLRHQLLVHGSCPAPAVLCLGFARQLRGHHAAGRCRGCTPRRLVDSVAVGSALVIDCPLRCCCPSRAWPKGRLAFFSHFSRFLYTQYEPAICAICVRIALLDALCHSVQKAEVGVFSAYGDSEITLNIP